ncbi:uncharacterized protein LOC123506951 isoform X2 [Portunus trituberculatus]|uniref:uncharacterized protein LOC123506951 isoform X2 n=1 Tax=Portunus trituberculatus TaxID=210409 RepID=UPI001E1CF7D7|nr:uncharacterized protein LOC123506951 isoform X2 [Portunus trituberculatus]
MAEIEGRKWINLEEFKLLPEEGQKEFIWYLNEKKGLKQDKLICDMDPKEDEMSIDSIRYQFWIQCQAFSKFVKLFNTITSDGKYHLPDVKNLECLKPPKDENKKSSPSETEYYKKSLSDVVDYIKKAKKFIEELQKEIEPQLNSRFKDFKGDQ